MFGFVGTVQGVVAFTAIPIPPTTRCAGMFFRTRRKKPSCAYLSAEYSTLKSSLLPRMICLSSVFGGRGVWGGGREGRTH